MNLEWHAYRHSETKPSKIPAHRDSALSVFHKRLEQRSALCLLLEDKQAHEEDGELWVFIPNGVQSGVPAEPPRGVEESSSGSWTPTDGALAADVQKQFFAALAAAMEKKLAAQEEFVLVDGFYEPNDAKFIFRCPSLTKLNHFEVYLDEEFPTPAFQLHFRIIEPTNVLTVAVDVVKRERELANSDREEELGDLRSSWERLVGLPSRDDHTVVDVWHLSEGLVPRIVAETKYGDVSPWFRAVAKRRHKRRMDDSDGSVGNEDELAKKEENEEDAEEEEEDTAQDQEVETDELLRRPVPGGPAKAKRKRDSADSMENDESFVPVSPDTHVNTPEATGQIIRMTFPHDDDMLLRVDSEVRRFKRRRRGHKLSSVQDPALMLTFGASMSNGSVQSGKKPTAWNRTNGVSGTELHPSQLFPSSYCKPGSATLKPRGDTKPLSVAVSLVESLSHNEQQEVLDGRPVKTHPLLQALQDYVDEEAQVKLRESVTASVSPKVKLLQTAEEFVPSILRLGFGQLSVNHATTEQLRLRLCSDRFKYWQSDYKKLQYPKNNRYQKKIHQRHLLLEFDEAKFREYEHDEAVNAWSNSHHFKQRDEEIMLGIQVAASGAVVTWRQEDTGVLAWSNHANMQLSAASESDKSEIVDRVQPYFQSLTSSLEKGDKGGSDDKKNGRDRRWISFEDYVETPLKSSDSTKRIECVRIEEPPKLCVSTMESSYHIEPAIISEYLLRDLHPVAAPKPVDYVIVCPQSPSQWLASLALSYFTCFRSMYAQCHMGDLAPIDLAQVEGNCYTRVDSANGLLLVDCAESMADPFANFRSAGELLNPVLSSGAIKKTQAFSRSAIANVVYLVVPLRRSDVKHKMWVLGAFARGLFGTSRLGEVSSWKDSVTLELVYLDDLYEVEVNPSPFVLMPNCFSLYDRVFENMNLKPADASSGPGKSRFLCERLYHLADWRADGNSTAEEAEVEPPYIYGGYVLSEDGKWLACSCTDAIGSILETFMLPVGEGEGTMGLESALLEMTLRMLQFFALFGDNAALVITRLSPTTRATSMSDAEQAAWDQLRSHRFDELIPPAYRPLLSSVLLLQLQTASVEEVQLLENPSVTSLYVADNVGFAVVSPNENSSARNSSRAVYFTGSDAWKTTSLAHGQHTLARKREARVLKVSLALALLESTGSNDGEVTESAPPSTMSAILRDFHAQSYLTMHPVTMERQSPLPLHLAAVSKMNRELQTLQVQLTTDPLQMR